MAELGFGVSGSRHGLDQKRPLQSHCWLAWPAQDQVCAEGKAEARFGQRERAVTPAPSPAPRFLPPPALPLPWPPRPSPQYLVSVYLLAPSSPPSFLSPSLYGAWGHPTWGPDTLLPLPSPGSRPRLSHTGASGWLSSRDNRGSRLPGGLSPPMTTLIPSFLLFRGCQRHQSAARPGPGLSQSPRLFSFPPEPGWGVLQLLCS